MRWSTKAVIFVLSIGVHYQMLLAKPAESEARSAIIENYRCVEHKQCQNPIAPDASGYEGTNPPPDIGLYDDDGNPIWTLSFCKVACRSETETSTDADDEYADTDQIRSGSNDVFNDLVNVCCAQEDLVPDELNKPNWALTKDPSMCKDFENSGYRCVPETDCKGSGYSSTLSDPEAQERRCTGDSQETRRFVLRTFQGYTAKYFDGNVCCRIADNNEVDVEDQTIEKVCSDYADHRCVNWDQCDSEKFDEESIENRGAHGNKASTTGLCTETPRQEDLTVDTNVRSGGTIFVSGRDRRRRQTDDEEDVVCCHERNIKPPCEEVSDTHRCVERSQCDVAGRSRANTDDSTEVRSAGDVLALDRYCAGVDGPRSAIDEISNAYNDFAAAISERRGRRSSDYDYPDDYSYKNYDDDYYGGTRSGLDELVCCPFHDILPDVVQKEGLESCDETPGYRCIAQERCRNTQILVSPKDEYDTDEAIVHTGVRVNAYNRTILHQDGNLCGSVLEVCCNVNDVPDLEETNDRASKPYENYKSTCGKRNARGVDVTVDGKGDKKEITQFGEWPNMCAVSVLNSKTRRYTYLGGASLITAGIVVTAAHKIMDIDHNGITVRCGDWDVKQVIEPRPYQDRSVDSVSVHPSFDSKNIYNDVALLHLTTEFNLDRHIDRICLPPPNDRSVMNGTECRATGWGKDKYEGGNYQVLLAQVKLPLVDNPVCQSNLREYTALSDTFELHDSFMCAGGGKGVDTCTGDGGGPLMCPSAKDPSRWIQAGITAWGIGCGQENVPGVYASMAEATCFVDWATKCKHGDKYTNDYDFERCKNWIDEEIDRLEDVLNDTEFHLDNSSLSRVQRKRYKKRLASAKEHLDAAEDMKYSCKSDLMRQEQGFVEEIFVRQENDNQEDYDYYDYDDTAGSSRDRK